MYRLDVAFMCFARWCMLFVTVKQRKHVYNSVPDLQQQELSFPAAVENPEYNFYHGGIAEDIEKGRKERRQSDPFPISSFSLSSFQLTKVQSWPSDPTSTYSVFSSPCTSPLSETKPSCSKAPAHPLDYTGTYEVQTSKKSKGIC